MAVTMFAGTFVGTIVGMIAQNRESWISRYLFGFHPVYGNLIGIVLVSIFLLAPILVFSGLISVSASEFFWGGCFAFSIILSFGVTCLTVHPDINIITQ